MVKLFRIPTFFTNTFLLIEQYLLYNSIKKKKYRKEGKDNLARSARIWFFSCALYFAKQNIQQGRESGILILITVSI